MVKKISYIFVLLLVTIVLISGMTLIVSTSHLLIMAINYNAILLLACGIALIIALIHDRYKDYKSEDDDYKKY
jgi:divalent metal cation (Fe/Co/Zn/Cd) transporter